MTEKVAVGVLSGVLQVSGFFTRSVVNSVVGKKFFKMLPGEMVLATLDGFCKSNFFPFFSDRVCSLVESICLYVIHLAIFSSKCWNKKILASFIV